MLNPEQAQEMLKQLNIEGEREKRLAGLKKLSGKLLEAAQLLFDDRKSVDWQGGIALYAQAGAILDELKPPERMRMFSIMFPGLEQYVEAAWWLQVTRVPYPRGYNRLAFRAPHDPSITRLNRAQWLVSLFGLLSSYKQDITWIAAWAAYIRQWGGAPQELGVLLAAAIEAGDAQSQHVFDILAASARGEHEVGAMGRHVVRALLVASRPDGWELIEKLLIAAQRQEGLRQVILESVDESHPEAFRRMLHLILDENLLRFSAAVRSADVWFGMRWNVEDVRTIRAFLERLAGLIDHPEGIDQVLSGHDAEMMYMALWLKAFTDVSSAFEPARKLLTDGVVERRFAAVHFLRQIGLKEARQALLPMLADEDLHIVAEALGGLHSGYRDDNDASDTDLFERLEQLLPRLTAKTKTLKPILWPWTATALDREAVAGMLNYCLGTRSPKRLIPYLSLMGPNDRAQVATSLGQADKADPDIRRALFGLVGDTAQWVRERALGGIAELSVTDAEALELEGLLHRKASDLRRAVLSILARRTDQQVLESADRLLETRADLISSGGLELLRLMIDAGRQPEACRKRAEIFRVGRAQLSDGEETLLETILAKQEVVASLDDALGLLNPAEQTAPARPSTHQHAYVSPAAIACIESLDKLAIEHSRTPVVYQEWGVEKEELFGNLPPYHLMTFLRVPFQGEPETLPLKDVWEKWWADRPVALRDTDGLELVRALALVPLIVIDRNASHASVKQVAKVVPNNADWKGKLKYPPLVQALLWQLVRLHPPENGADFLMDAAETAFALIPRDDLARKADPPSYGYYRNQPTDLWWRENQVVNAWLGLAREFRVMCSQVWDDTHDARLWRLARWIDLPGVEAGRFRPGFTEVLAAMQSGAATSADVLDHLLGPRPAATYGGYRHGQDFSDLRMLSGRKRPDLFDDYSFLEALVDQCRSRIVDVEARRGEMPTAASTPALALRSVFGMDALFRLIRALGREDFLRGWSYDGMSKQAVLSHLIRVTLPTDADTPEEFARQARAAKVSQRRLTDLAVYAPHWARFIEHVLKWKGLEDAVWWIHAHTKDPMWRVDQDVRELWIAEVTERTPLTGQDLIDGAVDVAWFKRVYKALGKDRWDALYISARFASGGNGYARAKLFADSMLGKVEQQALVDRFLKKRHQDSVRALGLLPLAKGAKGEAEVLERYEHIQEFIRTGKQFGSMRRSNEKLAAGIAMENLARTAGYADPMRLEWAMEGKANADMAGGSLTATAEGVTVSLAIDAWGDPQLSVEKQGKMLKSVPPKVKKDPQVAHLLERKQDIKKQTSRMRLSLEQAMCRGDSFTAGELYSLLSHPILGPMLEQLVFVSDDVMGFPVDGGKALARYDGTTSPVAKSQQLHVAHPYDLLKSGEWHEWQRECFLAERIQPFKQVFRELYVLTDAEQTEGNMSRRYAGHQVQPKQSIALLGQRGWIVHPNEGVRRTFHEANLSVWLSGLAAYFSPAEVEGETLESVHFSRRGEWKPMLLADVPPRIFSEAMRDIDLIVSVAHVGGVDPEASASTVEMRASLVRETCRLLKIDNAKVERSHVLVDGKLGNYSVHLGSAIVHRQPGGAVCIIPVHSQHHGRLFLPFADDDPRTAEVVSKVVLLARDDQIQDPTILEQLLAH